VDGYIALTEFGKRKFIEAGLPEKKIFVKPNFFFNSPEPFCNFEDYIVFIGRLSVEKGLDTLIDAFKILNSTNNKIFLKIVGDGHSRGQFEAKIKDENIQGVEFLGKKNQLGCMEIIKNARFIVMPSICYEMFPMTTIEAFACGKPVIASNLGALSEIIQDKKTGLLFKVGDAKDLAEKIMWLFENKDASVEMGKNALRVFEERFTRDKNYEILMDIYEKVMR